MQLVIDGKNRAKAAYHIGGKLRSSTGLQTGLACNLLSQIKKLLETHRTINKVHFLWEGPSSWRHTYFPDYKGDRVYSGESEDPDANSWPKQVALMQEVLRHVPFRYCISSTLEADDIGAIIARNTTEKTLLVSDDYDWIPNIRSGLVAIYQPKRATPKPGLPTPKPEDIIITEDNLFQITGYKSPAEIIEIFSICGDGGDGIPGCVGVAEKGAMSYIRGEMKASSQKHKNITAWKADPNGYSRSRTLFDPAQIPADLVNDYTTEIREFDEKGFRALAEKMEWGTVLKNWDRWCDLFRRLEQVPE